MTARSHGRRPRTRPDPEATAFRVLAGRGLAAARLEKGLTQAQLAEAADTDEKIVSTIECGQSNCTIGYLEQVARHVAWDPRVLLDDAPPMISTPMRAQLVDVVEDFRRVVSHFKQEVEWSGRTVGDEPDEKVCADHGRQVAESKETRHCAWCGAPLTLDRRDGVTRGAP